MITVHQKSITFEMPEKCSRCPMLQHDQYGNASIPYCLLLKPGPNGFGNCVDDRSETRDRDCPLKDGETYLI